MTQVSKTIGEIAGPKLETREQFDTAMEQMKVFSDAELQFEILQKNFSNGNRNEVQAIALSEAEASRRATASAEQLALRTTKLAACLGILGTLLGAILGAALAAFLSSS